MGNLKKYCTYLINFQHESYMKVKYFAKSIFKKTEERVTELYNEMRFKQRKHDRAEKYNILKEI